MQFSNEFNRKRYRLGLWFTAPAVLVLLTVLAYPIVASLVLSFLRVRFAGPGLTFQFYGLTNYTELFTNQLFRESLVRSVYFTLVEVAVVEVLALLVALMLNHPLGRPAFYRVVLLAPWALAPVANAVLWKWIYNANYGVLNQISGANLSRANLSGADLYGADLYGADLYGANDAEYVIAKTQICPQEGAFVGWKKLKGGVIAKLVILHDAKRLNSLGSRKCRASKVFVHEMFGAKEAYDQHTGNLLYKEGEEITPDSFDEDVRVECSHGIHFFMTRIEAERY